LASSSANRSTPSTRPDRTARRRRIVGTIRRAFGVGSFGGAHRPEHVDAGGLDSVEIAAD